MLKNIYLPDDDNHYNGNWFSDEKQPHASPSDINKSNTIYFVNHFINIILDIWKNPNNIFINKKIIMLLFLNLYYYSKNQMMINR